MLVLVGAFLYALGHAGLAATAGILVRSLTGGRDSTAMLGFEGPLPAGGLLVLAAAGVLAALVKMAGGSMAAWSEARVAGEVAERVRLESLDAVLALVRTQRLDGAPGAHAEQLAALTNHVGDVERGVAHGVLAELRAAVQLLPLVVLLVLLAPTMGAGAIVSLGAFALLAFSLRRSFKRANRESLRSTSSLVEASDQAVRHAELWASYGAKARIRAHVAALSRVLTQQGASVRLRAALLSSMSEVLGALAIVLALSVRSGLGLEQGSVAPFAIAFFMAYRPLRELVDARLVRTRAESALEAIANGIAPVGPQPPGIGEASQPLRARRWTLEPLLLRAVETHYGAHGPLSLSVAPGSIVAIVGPTGVGKTSLLRAMLGLEPIKHGSITYGSTELTHAGVGPEERPFAWVPQEAPVVADTLSVNLALGRADGADEGIEPRVLLERLGAYGLATAIGNARLGTERALSGGERSFVAVARALATELPVLVLDEPTSALDVASEQRMLEGLRTLRGERTILIVTHKPAPLAVADLVIRLEPRAAPAPGSPTFGE